MHLRRSLFSLVLVTLVSTAGISWLGTKSTDNLGSDLQKTTNISVEYARTINVSRQAQVNFQRQVQEWKNILIRGNDKALFDKYYKGFQDSEEDVQSGIMSLKPHFKNLGMNDEKINVLLSEHQKLGKKYREALSTFDMNDPETGKKVDKLLRGIDRPASKAMDELALDIEHKADEVLAVARADAVEQTRKVSTLLFAVSLISVIIAFFFSWFVGMRIVKKIGAEPDVLAKSADKISSGDLRGADIDLDVSPKSLSASLESMRMRVSIIVTAIKEGASEFDMAEKKLSSAITVKEAKDAIQEARGAIGTIKNATNRFKV